MGTFLRKVYTGSEWFMKMVKLNLVWLLFSVFGLFIFSLGPATTAATIVVQHWIKGDTEVKIMSTFFNMFKKYYIKSQVISMLLIVGYFILYIDFKFFLAIEHTTIKLILMSILIILLFILITITLYVFSILTKTKDLSYIQLFKTALYTGLSYVHWTVMGIAGIILTLGLTMIFPVSIFFLTGGVIISWITLVVHLVQSKIASKFESIILTQQVKEQS